MKFNIQIKSVSNEPGSQFKAMANIIVGDTFIIRNTKLFYSNRPYVTMPSIAGRSGRRFTPCHPLTSEAHAELAAAFLEAYHDYNDKNGLTEPEDDNEPMLTDDIESEEDNETAQDEKTETALDVEQ
jgi:DNA-binding cell septation regulator SpoVG